MRKEKYRRASHCDATRPPIEATVERRKRRYASAFCDVWRTGKPTPCLHARCHSHIVARRRGKVDRKHTGREFSRSTVDRTFDGKGNPAAATEVIVLSSAANFRRPNVYELYCDINFQAILYYVRRQRTGWSASAYQRYRSFIDNRDKYELSTRDDRLDLYVLLHWRVKTVASCSREVFLVNGYCF